MCSSCQKNIPVFLMYKVSIYKIITCNNLTEFIKLGFVSGGHTMNRAD